jgi:hypothetical protein
VKCVCVCGGGGGVDARSDEVPSRKEACDRNVCSAWSNDRVRNADVTAAIDRHSRHFKVEHCEIGDGDVRDVVAVDRVVR